MRLAALLIVVAGCTGEGYTPPKDATDPGNDVDGDGISSADGDCNDDDDTVYPGANDVVGDAIDQNCDNVDGLDEDLDGHAWTGSGGDDCDDGDPLVYTGAEEIGWDDIDQDCDGRDQFDFDKICAGKYHTCGLDTTGTVRCWGGDEYSQVTNRPLDAGWVDLDCGYEFACAVSAGGDLACWGRDEPGINQIASAPTKGGFERVFLGHKHGCALDGNGVATCWGDDIARQVSDAPDGVQWRWMGLGQEHSCAITDAQGIMQCWGDDSDDQQTLMPEAPYFTGFVQLTSGSGHLCAIRDDLGLKCWGRYNLNQTSPPSDAGPYSTVDSFYDFSCGIIEAEQLSCWGQTNQFQVTDAPTNESVFAVATGVDHGCALKNDGGEAICWGKNDLGQATVPWP